jgi:hypothetical protein
MSAERRNHGLHLVSPPRRSPARAKVAAAIYNAADAVPETAIYAVAHAHHPLPLQVTLRRGSTFPPCSRCEQPVEFRFLRAVDADGAARFQVRLNVLPVLDESTEDELPAPRRVALTS